MVCSEYPENINIKIYDDALNQVPKFKYLCSIFTKDGKNKETLNNELKRLKLCLIIKSNYSVQISLVWK
jgi:hypothetical protein